MTPLPDLKHALDVAAGDEPRPSDPSADLDRAQAAVRARSRRRFRLGVSTLATAALVGAASVVVLDGSPTSPPSAAAAEVQLVDQQFDAEPYTFDLTPEGWSVQAQMPSAVTIAPDDGSTSDEPHDFQGKLVILFDSNPLTGREVEHDGRRFWVTENPGHTIISTRTVDGEPTGVVRIQYPHDAGWEESSMIEFLASVHVGPGAQHGLG
ncbi:hypothetical protein [Phytoactinopolyspora halotolerans]|uniref:Uncharacterized protein n=1 Tax=Phytoactinopolyspora halotolerans TaxID=1981512 RepID=A0A6L9SK88_9ACTN|nr:hypothetical protein [Phytoactinopolyspora halotolerans]NEE04751.1 hypothetical protein [Phytoactinopolyspora halotolerans]